MAIIQCPECQKEVSENAVMCPNCGYGVKAHFDSIKNENYRKHMQEQKEVRSKKIKKHLKIWIPICVVVVAIAIAAISNYATLSTRTTFVDEKKMLDHLTSHPYWKLDHDQIDAWLIFHNDGFAEISRDDFSFDGGEFIIMQPKRGTFNLNSEQYIVLSNGKICMKNDNREYYYEPSLSPINLETSRKALKLEEISVNFENGLFQGEYKITNQGKRTYRYITAKATLYDKEQNQYVLDSLAAVNPENSDETYTFKPGESGTIEVLGRIENFIPEKIDIQISKFSLDFAE